MDLHCHPYSENTGLFGGKHDAYLELENFPVQTRRKALILRASFFWPRTQSERKRLALLTEEHRGDPSPNGKACFTFLGLASFVLNL